MSSQFDRKKIVPRYKMIAYVMLLIGVLIVGKALYISTVKRDYWMKVASRLKKDSVDVKPTRGNILSCDGRLMASSLPEFKMYMDFQALHDAKNDSLWYAKLDSICDGLHQIFPQKSATEFKHDLEAGHKKMSRNLAVWPRRVDYSTYSEVKKLPIFNMISYKGGFHVEEFNARKRPFGSLAGRTVGDMYGAKDTARFGLELSYDSILRGSNGLIHRRKVMNRYLNIMDTPPVDGADIVTTIDVSMQDLAERSVIDELKKINGNVGVAIVMEVATGDIKRHYAQTKLREFGVFLLDNPFWRSQVEQLNVLADGSVEMIPRVGNHIVYLGQPTHLNEKFTRLEKFYRYGLSKAGWNKYSYINIEFNNQIICKKRAKTKQQL